MDFNFNNLNHDDNEEYEAEMLCSEAMQTDDLQLRRELLNDALQVNPRCVTALTHLSRMDKDMGDLVSALVFANRAITCDRRHTEPLKELAWEDIGNRPYIRAYWNRMYVYEAMGDIASLIADGQHLVRITPGNNPVHGTSLMLF